MRVAKVTAVLSNNGNDKLVELDGEYEAEDEEGVEKQVMPIRRYWLPPGWEQCDPFNINLIIDWQ